MKFPTQKIKISDAGLEQKSLENPNYREEGREIPLEFGRPGVQQEESELVLISMVKLPANFQSDRVDTKKGGGEGNIRRVSPKKGDLQSDGGAQKKASF